jgi:hypothetical protein
VGEGGDSDHPKLVNLATIASGLGNTSHSDFFFGDGSMEQGVFDYDTLENINDSQVCNTAKHFYSNVFDRLTKLQVFIFSFLLNFERKS